MADSSDEELNSGDGRLDIKKLWHKIVTLYIKRTKKEANPESINDASSLNSKRIIDMTPIADKNEAKSNKQTFEPLISEITTLNAAETLSERIHFGTLESENRAGTSGGSSSTTRHSVAPDSPTLLNSAFIAPETPEIGQNLYRSPHSYGVATPIRGRKEPNLAPKKDNDTRKCPICGAVILYKGVYLR